jgi:drug/metabolite transporter (DMT)-like permease
MPVNYIFATIGLILTSLLWSGNIYVSKILLGEVSPIMLNCVRWLIAVIILTPFALRPTLSVWRIIWQSKGILTLFGFLGVTLYSSLLYTSAYTTSGINIAVISALTPLLTFLMAWLLFGIAPSKKQNMGFVLGVFGVMLLIAQGDVQRLLGLQFKIGDIWMLVASLAWAIYTVYLIKQPKGLSPIVFLYITTIIGVLCNLPILFWEVTYGEFAFHWQSQRNLIALIYTGIFPSVIAYLLFNWGAEILGPQAASFSSYLIPVFTAMISILFLNEIMQWYHLTSLGLVFAGVYIALKKESK